MARAIARALLLVAVGIGITLLVFPIPSASDDNGDSTTCIALRDGWSSEPHKPTLAEGKAWLWDPNRTTDAFPAYDRWEAWELGLDQCGKPTRDAMRWDGGFVLVCALGLVGLAGIERRIKRHADPSRGSEPVATRPETR